MKLNKSKGKVHPSPSSLSSSSSSSSSSSFSTLSSGSSEPISVLKLLPAAILTLISVLSLQDQEVLAYLLTHSLKSYSSFNSSSSSSSLISSSNSRKKKKSKKLLYSSSRTTTPHGHKSPSFDCGCFHCYTSYWGRWDTSPHRDLIDQAIEAFEEQHFTSSSEQLQQAKKTTKTPKSRKRDKPPHSTPLAETIERVVESSPEILDVGSPENADSPVVGEKSTVAEEVEDGVSGVHNKQQQHQHKGLARKVLPDVIGLLNSRFWNLWSPNV